MKEEVKKVNGITKFILLFGATLSLMCGSALSPSVTAMMAEFGTIPNAKFWISLILTLPALFVVIGGPISGILTDRYGRKKILVSALLLCGLSGSAGFLLHSIWAILASRALVGLGIAGVSTATNALISDLFDGQSRARFLGFQAAIMGFNGIVFLILGGFLANLNWHYAFLSYLPLVGLFPLAWIFIKEPKSIKHHGDEIVETKLRMDRKRVFILVTTFIGQFTYVTMPIFIAYYLTGLFEANSTTVGMMAAISSLASFLIGLVYGSIKKRLSFQYVFVIAFIVSAIGFLILGLANSWGLVILAEVFLGINVGLNLSNQPAWLASEVGPHVRGRANGIYVTMMYFGQFATSIVFSPISEMTGYAAIYFIVSGLSALTAFSLVFLTQGNRKIEQTS